MFAAKSSWKAILLLLAILAITVGKSTPAAATGIWWYGSGNKYNVTLINLTDKLLFTTYESVSRSNSCYPYPFQNLGVNVYPWESAVWLTAQTPVTELNYSGKLTFLLGGMESRWAFNLNFTHQDANNTSIKGTWVYLTANDTNNVDGWVPTWLPTFPFDLYPGYLGYATRLNDGKPHNLMNLEATELRIAVSVFSPNNDNVVVVVKTLDDYNVYRAWMLDWADNDQTSMPH